MDDIGVYIAKKRISNRAPFSDQKAHWVDLVCNKDGDRKELSGFLFDIRNGLIALITKTEKVIIRSEDVISVSLADSDTQETPTSQRADGEETAFEKALLDGSREIVERFFGNLETLKLQGYSDDEIINRGGLPFQNKASNGNPPSEQN